MSDPNDSTPPPISPSEFAASSAPAAPTPAAPADSNPGTEKVAGGLAPNVAAGLACLFSFIGGIIFLALEKKNKFVRFWAMQSTVLGLLWVAVAIVFSIVLSVLGGIPLIGSLLRFVYMLMGLGMFVVSVICLIKAFTNQIWDIPVLGKIARQQLDKVDQGAAAKG